MEIIQDIGTLLMVVFLQVVLGLIICSIFQLNRKGSHRNNPM